MQQPAPPSQAAAQREDKGTLDKLQNRIDNFCSPANEAFYESSPYRRLDTHRPEIRLLRIRYDAPTRRTVDGKSALDCQMEDNVRLSSAVGSGGYCALSYCAGDPKSTTPLMVNGLEFNTFANLAHAIECVRLHWKMHHPKEDLLLWVDQICINQSDLVERAAQVQMMRNIYQRANMTYVCLSTCAIPDCLSWLPIAAPTEVGSSPLAVGQDTPIVRAFKGNLENFFLGNTNVSNEYGESLDTISFCTHAFAFTQAPWWRRAWVFQEFLSSANVRFVAGDRSLSWEDFAKILQLLCDDMKPFIASMEKRLLTRIEEAKAEVEFRNVLLQICEDPEQLMQPENTELIERNTTPVPIAVANRTLREAISRIISQYPLKTHDTMQRPLLLGFPRNFAPEISHDWREKWSHQLYERQGFLHCELSKTEDRMRRLKLRMDGESLAPRFAVLQQEHDDAADRHERLSSGLETEIDFVYDQRAQSTKSGSAPVPSEYERNLLRLDAIPHPSWTGQGWSQNSFGNMVKCDSYGSERQHLYLEQYRKWTNFEQSYGQAFREQASRVEEQILHMISDSKDFFSLKAAFHQDPRSRGYLDDIDASEYYEAYLQNPQNPLEALNFDTEKHCESDSKELASNEARQVEQHDATAALESMISYRQRKIVKANVDLQRLAARLPSIVALQRYLDELDVTPLASMTRGKANIRRSGTDLKLLLKHSRNCRASDQRDRIYAFLGLAHTGYNIVPSYDETTAIARLLVDVAKAIIKYDSCLDILSHAYYGREKLGRKLPTWVPDWTSQQTNRGITSYEEAFQPKAPFDASKGTTCIEEYREDLTNDRLHIDLKARGVRVGALMKRDSGFQAQEDLLCFKISERVRGVTIASARLDDEVWVLCGASKPVLLRFEPGSGLDEDLPMYILLGEVLLLDSESEAYSDFMYGHAIELAKQQEIEAYKIEQFWII